MILLSIEDVTEREYYKRHLEELVEKRTAEIRVAREEAEKGKQIADRAKVNPRPWESR
jgi:chemotaxis protein methyltransferase CheR